MKYIDAKAIAAMLDMNPNYVRDRVTRLRTFPAAFRVGDSLRWRLDEVQQWIASQRVSQASRQSTRQAYGSRRGAKKDPNAQASAQDPERQEQQTGA